MDANTPRDPRPVVPLAGQVAVVTGGAHGIRVCAVCPEAVGTEMLRTSLAGGGDGVQKIAARGQVLSPARVASAAIRALKNGDFLVAPHPRTLRHAQRKWADVDQWIRAMNAFLTESEN
jgi:NAD(P)-dependent dehydrogenase (short-subunit alcohol dehydrogenase family)